MTTDLSVEKNDAEKQALRDRKTLDFLIATAGFGLCRAWIIFCLSAPLLGISSFGFNWMYLVAGALASLLVAFVVGRTKLFTTNLHRLLFWVCGAGLLLAAAIIPLALYQEMSGLLIAGFVVGGIGAGLLQVLWGERFAYYDVRFATIVSPAAAIVTALIVSVTDLTFIAYFAVPLFSFALLILLAQRTELDVRSLFQKGIPDQNTFSDNKSEDSSSRTPQNAVVKSLRRPGVGKLMFSIMIFSLLCRIFDSVPLNGADPFAFFGGSVIFSLVVVGAIFLIFAALFKDRFDPTLTYRFSLPIMVAGFAAIALFFDTHAAWSILLINVGYEFFDILVWIIFVEISRKDGENPLRIFGLGVAFMFIGMAVGSLAGNIINTLILNGSIQITVIAMVSILSLVIVAFLVLPEGTIDRLFQTVRHDKKEERSPEHTASPSLEGILDTSCVAVAEEYKLTPREGEVLVLLAYGRTLAIISRDLHIAKGTARTHIENIYRKLDVHKQQELIDLVEDYEPR